MGTKDNETTEVVLDSDTVDIEEVLKDILTPMLKSLQKDLQGFIKTTVAESVKAQTPDDTQAPEGQQGDKPNAPVSPEVKALQAKLAAMEKKAADQEAREKQNRMESALSEIVQGYKTQDPKLAQLALKNALGELVEADGGYLTADGTNIADAAKEFFKSSTGQILLPADMRQGSGVPQGRVPRASAKAEVPLEDALMSTFGAMF